MLEKIDTPNQLKDLSYPQLEELANDIRQEIIGVVPENGGHLASNLGVVELTIALHRVFDSPRDKLIWDVGHQVYVHKLLTSRRDRFASIRQYGGLSGFPDRKESPHDAFGAGHASTAISAGVGMALARDLSKENYQVVSIIGDGAFGGGMAFEALNHAGQLGTKLIVVLNDNGMAISPSVGALSRFLNIVRIDSRYEIAKQETKKAITKLPFGDSAWGISKQFKGQIKRAVIPGALWERLGFVYLGPIDGHNIWEVEGALTRARDYEKGPTLVHVITTKGKGYLPAEANSAKFHGMSPRNGKSSPAPSYSAVLGRTVLQLMKEDERVVAITAAMLDGTQLSIPAAEFPERVIDVGICEQHAVTMAAGLAAQGFRPVVAVYSTFLQRAYDQMVHDVCLQNLPVTLAVDRAGLVGDDGKTHQGAFDVSFLRSIPNMAVAAPKDEAELRHLLYTAVRSGRPMALRYPRGHGFGVPLAEEMRQLPIGKAELLRDGDDVAILALGTMAYRAMDAAARLTAEGIDCAVVNARFAKPLDAQLIAGLAAKTGRVLTLEENVLAGGFGSGVLEVLSAEGLGNVAVQCAALPDAFVDHGPPDVLLAKLGLDVEGITNRVRRLVADTAISMHGTQKEAVG